MLKTGIVSSAYFGWKDYEQGLRKMKSHGYDCMDYGEITPRDSLLFDYKDSAFEKYFRDFSACAKETGIEIFQMHGLWPRYADGDVSKFDQDMELYLKELSAAEYMECKRLILHPCMPYGWGEEPDRRKAFEETLKTIEYLLRYAKKAGVTICVENMPFQKGHSFSQIQEIKELIRTINDTNVKACFDTGHSYCTQEDIYECILTLGNDLEALHVHDDVACQDRHLIPFQGGINWQRFIQGLRDIHFEGCISFETSISLNMPEPVRETMQKGLAELARWFARQVEN